MGLSVLYAAAFILSCIAEVVLLAVLIIGRRYKSFPIFTAFMTFTVGADIGIGLLAVGSSKAVALSAAVFLLPPQYLLEAMVLFEIAWHVLRPVHSSLPPRALQVFALSMFLAVVCGSLLAWHVRGNGSHIYAEIKRPLDLTVSLLRMLIFVVIAAFAQLLGIGWKDRVLQLATALSFYSAVDLIVNLVQSHTGPLPALNHVKAVNFLFEMCFLVWAFTTKEVRRRDFSPQMEQFLVTLAGRAKGARTVLVRTQVK